jgi:hypothetical protein
MRIDSISVLHISNEMLQFQFFLNLSCLPGYIHTTPYVVLCSLVGIELFSMYIKKSEFEVKKENYKLNSPIMLIQF